MTAHWTPTNGIPPMPRSISTRQPARPQRRGTWWALVLETLRVWQQRAAQRAQLAELDDFRLRDLGLTREEAFNEARKARLDLAAGGA